MSRKLDYTYFELSYAAIQCFYTIRNGQIKVGIKSKIPKTMYNSYLNDACEEAIEHYNRHHSITQVNSTGEIYKT